MTRQRGVEMGAMKKNGVGYFFLQSTCQFIAPEISIKDAHLFVEKAPSNHPVISVNPKTAPFFYLS
jgi:hypothetical protein